ncbi:MAG: hypothetical protein H7A25_18050 [Leptospiraceae bacterium]|nr:hypothetical protein [Leptospiraceae bacterium]
MKQKKILLILFIFTSCFWSSGKIQIKDDSLFHLIIDAGSSGTRFCLYTIQKNSNGKRTSCKADYAGGDYRQCKEIIATNGIARLGLEEGKNVLLKGLADLEFKYPALRAKIKKVIITGTGGFREILASEATAIMSGLEDFLKKKGYETEGKIITGEEEAELAYYSSLQISADHEIPAILEIGGASIQLAFPAGGQESAPISKVSDSIGAVSSYKTLTENPNYKNECFQAPSEFFRSRVVENPFEACRNLILQETLEKSRIKSFLLAEPFPSGTKVLGMGALWGAIFKHLDEKTLSREKIDETGKKYCLLTAKELNKKYDIPEKYASKQCYSYAYLSALMEFANLKEIHSGNGESYTLGAAVSPAYFECAPSVPAL